VSARACRRWHCRRLFTHQTRQAQRRVRRPSRARHRERFPGRCTGLFGECPAASYRRRLAARAAICAAGFPRRQRFSTAGKKAWLDEWSKHLSSDEIPINQYRVIRDLMRTLDRDNVIITHDSGSPREQLLPFWETTVPGSYMGWGKSTQLGYGLGSRWAPNLQPRKNCAST
jgi:hypothetical protein